MFTVSSSVAKRMGKTSSSSNVTGHEDEGSEVTGQSDCVVVTQPEDVLVIALGNLISECPGMLSESKVNG